jgi:hypothetical protein
MRCRFPDHRTFAKVAQAMRADLWGRSQRLDAVEITITWHDDWTSGCIGKGELKVVLCCETTFTELRDQVLATLHGIVIEHGTEGLQGEVDRARISFRKARRSRSSSDRELSLLDRNLPTAELAN